MTKLEEFSAIKTIFLNDQIFSKTKKADNQNPKYIRFLELFEQYKREKDPKKIGYLKKEMRKILVQLAKEHQSWGDPENPPKNILGRQIVEEVDEYIQNTAHQLFNLPENKETPSVKFFTTVDSSFHKTTGITGIIEIEAPNGVMQITLGTEPKSLAEEKYILYEKPDVFIRVPKEIDKNLTQEEQEKERNKIIIGETAEKIIEEINNKASNRERRYFRNIS